MTLQLAQRNIRLLMFFNFFQDFIPTSVFTILIFAEISGSFTAAAAAYSITMLSTVLAEVPTGILSDKVGRKGTMILGACFSTLGMVCYALAQDAGLLFVGSVIGGISTAFYSGNNEAILYDTLSDVGRELDFPDVAGRAGSMFQVAGALSAVTGSILAATLGYRAMLIVTIFPQVICIFVALLMVNPTRHAGDGHNPFAHLRQSAALIWRNPRLRALTLGDASRVAFGEATFHLRAAFFERLWPVWAIGLLRAMSNVLGALSFYFAGRIIRRFGERRIMIGVPLFANLIDIVWVTFAGVLSPFMMSLNSIMYGAIKISSTSLTQREFSPQHRATMGSVSSLMGSIGFAIVSLLFGMVSDMLSPDAAMILGLLGTLTAVFWYYKAFNLPATNTPEHAAAG